MLFIHALFTVQSVITQQSPTTHALLQHLAVLLQLKLLAHEVKHVPIARSHP